MTPQANLAFLCMCVYAFVNIHLFIFSGEGISSSHQILKKLLDPNMRLESSFSKEEF